MTSVLQEEDVNGHYACKGYRVPSIVATVVVIVTIIIGGLARKQEEKWGWMNPAPNQANAFMENTG